MVFAAVAGHLQSLDFTDQHKKWHSCNPVDLYTAPVVKFVPEVSLHSITQIDRPAPQPEAVSGLVLNLTQSTLECCSKILRNTADMAAG